MVRALYTAARGLGPAWVAPAVLLAVIAEIAYSAEPAPLSLAVSPDKIELVGPDSRFQLLVDGLSNKGELADVTRRCQFKSLAPEIVRVSPEGVLQGLKDGKGLVEASLDGKRIEVPVSVVGSAEPRRYNFENHVVPILGKFGCNSGGCHGKAEGQNGFKLSVFGFDPPADYRALTMEGRGRRVFPAAPERSLLLLKSSGGMAHGGGVRIDADSPEYQTLRGWIAAGLPVGSKDDPRVIKIELWPRERRLAMRQEQQLRVIATTSDGRRQDITALAQYQSNNEGLASVDAAGLVLAGETPGQVAVMATYMGCVDVFQAIVPRPESIEPYPTLVENNFIDGLVYRRLRQLNIAPSGQATDAEFLRRAYLDLIGTLPTSAEARRFLADERPDRRAKLVDELLGRDEFADYWALQWADLLRVDRQALGHKPAYDYYRWIRESLAANKPLDQFVREILTAEGPLAESPQGYLFRVAAKPGEAASAVSQVFLGVRIECAQCHHHPHDRWSQTDYAGMTAFFSQLATTKSPLGDALEAKGDPQTKHPRSGETVFAHALGTAQPEKNPAGDRRRVLADWMTAADNPFFARNIANRVWARLLGRGLVEPLDDFRATNPPTNPELLDALGKHFVESRFDLKALIRTITASRVYQHSSAPNPTNIKDEQNYSRALWKRPAAEVLLDAICQVTGVPEKFDEVAAGGRAIELWDSQVQHYFLRLFGRPVRKSVCECERNVEPSVAQVLHLLNSERVNAKIAHESGAVAKLVRKHADDAALVEELYLSIYSRFPTDDERQTAVKFLQSAPGKRRQAAEDLTWTMLNSLEFVFNR
jgi:hypothetical protein